MLFNVNALSQIFARRFSFVLNETHRQIRDAARKFALEEILPIAAHHDKTTEFPLNVIKKAHSNGFMNPIIPKAYGGPGLSIFETSLINEQFAYACSTIQICIMHPSLCAMAVLLAGSEEQKKKYLSMLSSDVCFASYAITEPDGGSDVAGTKTTAVLKGDNFVLNGTKKWIEVAQYANWFVILARTDFDLKVSPGKAFTAFIVDRDLPGVTLGKRESTMGQRCMDIRSVSFKDVVVPKENVLGRIGDGFKIIMKAFDHTRPIVASGAVGISSRALDEASKYALERKAFGVPIAQHQAVSFMLADMAINLELSRLMTYKAAAGVDNKEESTSYFAAIAKAFATDTANQAATNAVQIFGGAGYSCDYPVEKLMRDVKCFQIFEGTNQIQRVIIARELVQKMKECGTIAF